MQIAGKTTLPTQLSAVQIVQGQPGTLTTSATGTQQVVSATQSATTKQLPSTTVTMQQIHQVIKQVQQQHQQAQAAQVTSHSDGLSQSSFFSKNCVYPANFSLIFFRLRPGRLCLSRRTCPIQPSPLCRLKCRIRSCSRQY